MSAASPAPAGPRQRRTRSRELVVLLVGLVVFYAVLIGWRGVSLFGDHRLVVKGLGLGVVLLPLIGLGLVGAELRFGRAAERLGRRLGTSVALPFAEAKAAVQAAPDDWRAWYRVAVAYGAAGDSRRGRQAMRRAIRLERAATRSAGPVGDEDRGARHQPAA